MRSLWERGVGLEQVGVYAGLGGALASRMDAALAAEVLPEGNGLVYDTLQMQQS